MGVTPYNVIMGVGNLYVGAFSAAEPADTVVNTTPASSAWTPMGATQDGVTMLVNREFAMAEVDQVSDPVGSSMSKREIQVKFNLAEATLANLQTALADDGSLGSGSGYSSLTPEYAGSEMTTVYKALIFDGYGPSDAAGTKRRRRFICRKVLSIDNIEAAYKKDGVVLIPVTMRCHYVSDSVGPIKIVDESNTV